MVLYDKASVKKTVVCQRICEVICMMFQQYANFALKKQPDDSRVLMPSLNLSKSFPFALIHQQQKIKQMDCFFSLFNKSEQIHEEM